MDELQLTLGTNKVVTLTPWKSKTKKEFIKLFKEKGDKVGEQDIVNILVTPYIDKKDLYYSAAETQYILTKLREISIDSDINFGIDCDNTECGKEIEVETNLTNLIHYKEGKFPFDGSRVVWKDLNNTKSLLNAVKKYNEEPPSFIEVLLHIEKIDEKLIASFTQITEIFDDLSLSEAEKIEDEFKTVAPSIEINQEIECPHCNLRKLYNFDVIPTFFDPLLPKDM